MCNLYSQTRNVEAIRRLFNVSHNRATAFEPQPAIFPGWKPSFEQRRCLVPASSYCEPDTGKPAKWHWFAINCAGRFHEQGGNSLTLSV